ncbi:hypothetical protein PHYPSEUDO_002436 [Phytophthora pseudosyringae]|uniref:Uncharacterized protein n=1 Tax=Phytophthora pseudosyringae TaxID=221518 RepID=A0A8T1VT56_9STRA|nr:hypothetical protein PHYPSEUDO_002436 [Phytophthora pseudosyringae]
MEPPQPDRANSDDSRSMLRVPTRFQAHLDKLHKQQVVIQQLEREKLEQTQRMNELEGRAERSDRRCAARDAEIARLRREIADREHESLRAAHTIDTLTRQVQEAQEMTTRAEQAQRDAEADYTLRRFLAESDDGSDVENVAHAEQQHKVSELEDELAWFRAIAEALSHELQEAKDARNELELQLQASKDAESELNLQLQQTIDAKRDLELQFQQAMGGKHDLDLKLEKMMGAKSDLELQMQQVKDTKCEQELQHQLETARVKTADALKDSERWKSMSTVCRNLVTVLRAQVNALADDKQKLERASLCCQRSTEKRLQGLEQDRQNLELENIRLRGELARLQQDFKDMELQLRKLDEEEFKETLVAEEDLMMRLARAQAHQQELTTQIQDVEHKLAKSADAAALNMELVVENKELLQQLEEERCHSKELAHSMATYKKATETALQQLKDVEIELRAMNSSHDASDEQHETVASFARLVISDLKRQQQASVESAVASMQVLHLTSLVESWLNRLRARREILKHSSASMSSSDSEADATSDDPLSNYDEILLD